MNKLPNLSDEEAADFALTMSEIECAVICLCSKEKSWRYTRISKMLGLEYGEVQAAGRSLQQKRLAFIEVIPYDGSAIFLNHRGEQVKNAVQILSKMREAK